VIYLPALQALRSAKDRYDIAALLGYKPSSLAYIVYRIPPGAKYTTFAIQKKAGGERQIDAPIAKLKGLQKRLAVLLYDCLQEIEESEARKNKLSHAYRRGFSIISNASAHRARRYVLNIDLQNFFPGFNFGRVRGFFIKNKHFQLVEPVATLIAQIACNNGVLPQGSPCSPVITELLTHFLDIRLVRLAAKNKCSYSRYADDITFSTNQKIFPVVLAVPVGEGWLLSNELKARIQSAGFAINDAKTRMQVRASRQTVTGLTVNTKVNVPQHYYKRARAMTHQFLSTGKYIVDGAENTSVQKLEGILSHIYYIRERLIDLAILGQKNKERRVVLQEGRKIAKNKSPSGIRLVYYRLVFFKHFVAPSKPLIICEGKTDPIYLKCAIRQRAAQFPILVAEENGKQVFKVNFFKYSKQARDVLQLRGGSADLKSFIAAWRENFATFKYCPSPHPIIVLIDNDDGAKEIFGLIKGKFKVPIGWDFDEQFYHLDGPLYLIKTPIKAAEHKSCIEDFFDATTLGTSMDGRKFNPEIEDGAEGEYGKVDFAEKVVRPNAHTIDFQGFDHLLSRIVAVIQDYDQRKAAAAQ
jgi:RNA-directed DNA polymerase